ncbi:hypothetical protein [Allopontixanthobacter sp.]|uniref:hypothetical protein n=1 Tax=Allopontixanthobacter sp. TaxID=2906452 RepID=UPI002AB95F2B|nr:hypothetical protein [Allopontixanthobacter sp.]MDZ4308397.1 hypothetical protein [Allopontixanthobacter sp.]
MPARPPLSTHPVFPVIAAVWFASLLGIGSLIVPAALFEHAAVASGLTTLLPAAQAPLGFTARLMIAGTGAIAGAITGLLLARRIAAIGHHGPAARGIHGGGYYEKKVPISAHEELGATSLDQAVEATEPAALVAPSLADEGTEIPQPAAARVDVSGMAEQLIRRPLDELGIVQLVERLALAMQQQPAGAFHDTGQDRHTAAPLEEEEFSSLLTLRKEAAEPRRSVALPSDDECDLADSVAVFPGRETASPRRRIEAPFSIAAPQAAAAPSGADETERTLRGALDQLRRVSGTR